MRHLGVWLVATLMVTTPVTASGQKGKGGSHPPKTPRASVPKPPKIKVPKPPKVQKPKAQGQAARPTPKPHVAAPRAKAAQTLARARAAQALFGRKARVRMAPSYLGMRFPYQGRHRSGYRAYGYHYRGSRAYYYRRPPNRRYAVRPSGTSQAALTQLRLLEKLKLDLDTITPRTHLTPTMSNVLQGDLLAIAPRGSRPSLTSVRKLSGDLATALAHRRKPPMDTLQLARDLATVMNSPRLPAEAVNLAIASSQGVLKFAGARSSEVELVASDLRAIAAASRLR
ncbi:MAG: hypothetical protein IRY99_25495 [Isosphaeraceae bacterium]|nr:hypothetical protein [Isosphaeraceae bacterium]